MGGRLITAWTPCVAEDDERRLLDRCLAGDEDACAALVDAYARMAESVSRSE